MRGIVNWFDVQKGYGFIIDPDGKDVFVHYTQIQMDGFRFLNEGDIVEFEINWDKDKNRIQAVNVRPVLTVKMVEEALRKDDLYLARTDNSVINMNLPWMVVDINNVIQTSEHGMDLVQVAEYAGIDISELAA